jgi:protein-tyrosine phosphatase
MMESSTRTVLFLCTGNYYRSRFAEILFNALAGPAGLRWRAESRGLALERGVSNVGPISADVLHRLAAGGICAKDYLRMPRQLGEEDLRRASLVIALKEAEHRPLLQSRHPGWAQRVEYWHVHDLDFAPATEALAQIERLVLGLVDRLQSG